VDGYAQQLLLPHEEEVRETFFKGLQTKIYHLFCVCNEQVRISFLAQQILNSSEEMCSVTVTLES